MGYTLPNKWCPMFLESIALTRMLPCLAYPGRIIVIGRPSRSLDDVLPYLATLPGVIAYNPQVHTLTFRRQPGFLTLYSQRVYITQVNDIDEGLELLSALVDAINATWERRADLVAITVARRAPRPLDIWTLLPQTNCKLCGEQTCMAFACNLLLNRRELAECLPMHEDPAFHERRATLEAMT
jgi:ArsR family metal-binding transcriptional regulator